MENKSNGQDDRYCGDILIQIAAVNSSLKSLENNILNNHLKSCVTNNLKYYKNKNISLTLLSNEISVRLICIINMINRITKFIYKQIFLNIHRHLKDIFARYNY